MKKLLSIILILTLVHTLIGQEYSFEDGTNFESNDGFVHIITFISTPVWQIGPPQKTYFDGAYSSPNAIVTDTTNFYPMNVKSSFYFSIKDWNWFYGSPSVLSFYHKYDTDSLMDGGMIEVSYDGGITWLNIIHDSTMYNCDWTDGHGYEGENFYGDDDVLYNGQNGFSGRSDGWIHSTFTWTYCVGVKDVLPDSMMVRFTFISDGIQTNKEGWLIDDISVNSMPCGSVRENHENQITSFVRPNPFKSDAVIEMNCQQNDNYSFSVYDLNGKLIVKQKMLGKNIQLDQFNFPPGLYTYVIHFDNSRPVTGKFIRE